MGRLHSKGKGISASAIPYSRSLPAWFKTTPEQVVEQICKLARKGATPSQIGVILRDSHGVAQVKIVTGTFCRFRKRTFAIELRSGMDIC
jgi:small subunit ribosomal protein S13e